MESFERGVGQISFLNDELVMVWRISVKCNASCSYYVFSVFGRVEDGVVKSVAEYYAW